MKKAIAGFYLGLACLFLISITWGNQVLTRWEPRTTTKFSAEKKSPPGQLSPAEMETRKKKVRLFLNPFDLANGLTFQELDDIRHNPNHRLSSFLFLLGALWLARGLRRSKTPS